MTNGSWSAFDQAAELPDDDREEQEGSARKSIVLRCAGCSETYTADHDDCPLCGNANVSEVVRGPE